MKNIIFGSTVFITGIVSSAIILASPKDIIALNRYAVFLILTAIVGFVIMLIEIVGIEKIKNVFRSDYDIDGRPKKKRID